MSQGSIELGRYEGKFEGSALMLAIRQGKRGVVEKLVAAGAKAGTTDKVKGRDCHVRVPPRARWVACCVTPCMAGV
jgi:hypothetical protein